MPVLHGPGWKIPGISAIIFDKDGTIIDSHLYWGEIVKRRASAVVAHYGMSKETFGDVCRFMGYSTTQSRLMPEGPVALAARPEVIAILKDGLSSFSVHAETLALESIFGDVMSGFNKDIFSYIKLLPGVEDFLVKAKVSGIRLALVTSDSAVSTKKIMAYTGLANYFDAVIGRESVTADKKTGVPALKALEHLEVSPSVTVAIGDAPVDALMSANAGLKAAIMVATGQLSKSELAHSSSFVAESFRELSIA